MVDEGVRSANGEAPPPRPPRALQTRLALLLGVVALFLLASLAAQLTFQVRLSDRREDLVQRVDRATQASGDLRAAVLEQQSSVRGYLLTADARFADTYERARTAAEEAAGRLRDLVEGSPQLEDEVAALERSLAAWQDASAEPSLDPADAEQARSSLAVETGEDRFDVLRADIGALEDGLEQERRETIDEIEAAHRAVLAVVFGVPMVLAVLGAIIAAALNRLVLNPLARLGSDARRVAAGELSHRVEAQGPPELVSLGRDVEAMRARIVTELDELTAIRADLERQHAELERSNADLEQFAYVASHDLQEPLRKVAGFCQLLAKRYGDQLDDRAREYIWYAADGARRMQDLINDLLAFSRVGRTTERFTPVDLGELVREALELFAEPIEQSGATVTVGDLPVVAGDRRLLAAVLQNLLSNGLKFRRDEPPRVDIRAALDQDTWTVTVADNGIGIEPEYADQIFTIFRRLHHKTEYEGTGIGLALCKKIVEFHGGRIWLEPRDDAGTTFSFTLPAGPASGTPPTTEDRHDALRS